MAKNKQLDDQNLILQKENKGLSQKLKIVLQK